MSRFQHPDFQDEDPDDVSRLGSGVRRLNTWLVGASTSLLTLGFIVASLLVFASQLRSCVSRDPVASGGISPRAPIGSDTTDRRLVTRFAATWISAGGELDSLHVWMFDDPSINAASLGAGRFVLFRGLQPLADDALDAIYAHEVAHDQLRHAQKVSDVSDVTDALGEALTTLGGGSIADRETVQRWTGAFVVPTYSRVQELQADSLAVELLRERGIPNPLITVCGAFRQLRAQGGEAGGGFFASHPALSERMVRLARLFPAYPTEGHCQ